MKKRAASISLLLASSLLLAGCDLPKNLEDIIQWRDKFTLNVTVEQIQQFLGLFVMIIVAFVAFRTLFGIPQDFIDGVPFRYSRTAWGLSMMFAVGLLYSLIPIANGITAKNLPGDITIDSVLSNLHLELTIDPIKLLTQAWAINVSIILPLIVSGMLFFDLLALVAILAVSAVWQRNKAIWVVIAIWLGHLMFLLIFVMTQYELGQLFPEWPISVAGSTVSSLFLWIIGFFGAVCYIFFPLVGLITGPEVIGPSAMPKEEKEQVAKKRREPVNLQEVVPIFFPSPGDNHEDRRPPVPGPARPNSSDPDVVDGEFRVIPTGEIASGQVRRGLLSSGLPPSGSPPDPGGKPSSPNSSPKSGGSPGIDPNRVPPVDGSQTQTNHKSSGPKNGSVPPASTESSNRQTNRNGSGTNGTAPPVQTGDVVTADFKQVVPPSEKIGQVKNVITKAAIVTKVVATVAGQGEIAAAAQAVQTGNEVILGAAQTQQQAKEKGKPVVVIDTRKVPPRKEAV